MGGDIKISPRSDISFCCLQTTIVFPYIRAGGFRSAVIRLNHSNRFNLNSSSRRRGRSGSD